MLHAANTLEQQDAVRREQLAHQGIVKVDGDVNQARDTLLSLSKKSSTISASGIS